MCRLKKLFVAFFVAWSHRLTESFRCSGNKSFSWPIHSLILSLLFFSISRCGNLYASCWAREKGGLAHKQSPCKARGG